MLTATDGPAGDSASCQRRRNQQVNHRRPDEPRRWERALKASAKVEMTYGLERLGPWDDFEWGLINGKLSALRWVLGHEWDMLDN